MWYGIPTYLILNECRYLLPQLGYYFGEGPSMAIDVVVIGLCTVRRTVTGERMRR